MSDHSVDKLETIGYSMRSEVGLVPIDPLCILRPRVAAINHDTTLFFCISAIC